MAENLEVILTNQATKRGMDINQMIETLKDYNEVKKMCLEIYHSKNLTIDDRINNCVEKFKHSYMLYAKITNNFK